MISRTSSWTNLYFEYMRLLAVMGIDAKLIMHQVFQRVHLLFLFTFWLWTCWIVFGFSDTKHLTNCPKFFIPCDIAFNWMVTHESWLCVLVFVYYVLARQSLLKLRNFFPPSILVSYSYANKSWSWWVSSFLYNPHIKSWP